MAVDSSYLCRWVRDRLPLLAGGELTGSDRRKVERHLIGCPGCRRHERSLAGALGALHAAAGLPPSAPEAPSLWPALARQIRESRREPRGAAPSLARALTGPGSWLDALFAPPARLRPAFVLASALAVAVVSAAGVDAWVRGRLDEAGRQVAADPLPVGADGFDPDLDPNPLPPPVVVPGAEFPSPPVVLEPAPAPGPAPSLARADLPARTPERNAPARFDYDLDHGTPMGPNSHDVKASY